MNSQTSKKQTKARPNKNTAESAENITAMKRNQNIYNNVPAISSQAAMKRNQNIYNDVPATSSQAVSRKSIRLSTDRTSNILGRTGYQI